MSAEHLFYRFFRRIVSVVTTVLTVAMWLLWCVLVHNRASFVLLLFYVLNALLLPGRLCAWMHQWHPLITPEWHAEAAESKDTSENSHARF
jgi:hypothetical protein